MDIKESIKKYSDLIDRLELDNDVAKLQQLILQLPDIVSLAHDYPNDTLRKTEYVQILKEITEGLNKVLSHANKNKIFVVADIGYVKTALKDYEKQPEVKPSAQDNEPIDVLIKSFETIRQQVNDFTLNKHTRIVDFNKFTIQLLTNINFMLAVSAQAIKAQK